MNEINGFTLSFPARLQATELSGDEKWNENDCEHMKILATILKIEFNLLLLTKKGCISVFQTKPQWIIRSATSYLTPTWAFGRQNTKMFTNPKYIYKYNGNPNMQGNI